MTRVHRIGAATSTSSTQGAGWVGMKWKDTENGFPEELVQSSVWKGSHDFPGKGMLFQAREAAHSVEGGRSRVHKTCLAVRERGCVREKQTFFFSRSGQSWILVFFKSSKDD